MSTKDQFIFRSLHIVAWIIFVGLCVEAGGLLVNFFFSIYEPSFIRNLYQKLDISQVYDRSQWAFFSMYSFILVIAVLKAYLFYIVIMLMHRLDLSNPFNRQVSEQITAISYYTFSIGMISFIARQVAKNIQNKGIVLDNLHGFWEDSQAFILMSAVIYIIALIFRRGIELQRENDLTI